MWGLANAAFVPQRLNEVLAFAFCAGGASSYLDLPVFYGGMCAPRQGENGICGCRHDSVCRVSCVGGSDAGDWIFTTSETAVIIRASARITDMRIL